MPPPMPDDAPEDPPNGLPKGLPEQREGKVTATKRERSHGTHCCSFASLS
ncbi:hypothetical protein JCM4814A_90570 [Streptomyces phaeofaciens JCM 4814]|uniref:Uncharacterized protein n=1 Tax=Streptomyces phaeofaciens TaxID=68254 RepID=A0A918HD10_9ACTN|nr:hypothetical protein GCM10010226_30960 [Streptomyces phaeofaciens]